MEGQILVALRQVLGPVANRPSHEAREDEVKVGAEVPIILQVIDVEGDVRWNTGQSVLKVTFVIESSNTQGRLNRAEIDARNVAFGVLIG